MRRRWLYRWISFYDDNDSDDDDGDDDDDDDVDDDDEETFPNRELTTNPKWERNPGD